MEELKYLFVVNKDEFLPNDQQISVDVMGSEHRAAHEKYAAKYRQYQSTTLNRQVIIAKKDNFMPLDLNNL